jgi:hypothetical protein
LIYHNYLQYIKKIKKKKNGIKKLQLGIESKTAFMALLKLDLHKKNQFLHKLKVDWSDLVKPILTQTL